MKELIVCLLILLGFTLSNCTEKKKTPVSRTEITADLIHPLYFQEEVSSLINFPFWFNDSIVSGQKIKQLTITSYKGVLSDTNTYSDSDDETFPKRTIIYTFNQSGRLVQMQITDFSEGIIISNQSFQIGKPGILGYCEVVQKDNLYGVENNTFTYDLNRITADYAGFEASNDLDLIHFILNKKYFGPLSVDSIASPLPNDWIILGKPDRPEKRYKVQNKVKEKFISTYSYYSYNYPKVITNEDYPFFKKRYFNYEKGHFKGYTDSTFIDEIFVTSIKSFIYYNNKRLPEKAVHKKEHAESMNQYQTQEIFNYSFYE
ncbi:hypothetical protein [Fluviicola sp.]|jgi:hypothetical protein|uniref:hypothetical protein n=1 Tax=Fluviicola sp. TaxID=1917219 RepID=UPI0028317E44|nr:hypothetical protein [Fluviicola sp.]MDR0802669.1 hypothetical protein [Fluviicola sp.]